MEYVTLYLHHSPPQKALKDLFIGLHEQATVRSKGAELLIIQTPVDPHEPMDYEEIYALIMADFDQKISILVLESPAHAFLDEATVLDTLPKVPKAFYQVEDFLLTLIKRFPKSVHVVKTALSNTLGRELIQTALALADANMNASIAAKQNYMHRNTMLYRIDRIHEKTGIHVKSFAGLSIFTQLYRH